MKLITASGLTLLFLSAIISCNKTSVKNAQQRPLSIFEREKQPTNALVTSDYVEIDGVTPSAITSVGCGQNATGSFVGTGFHPYPNTSINLTGTPDYATIQLTCHSANVPNKFGVSSDVSQGVCQSDWMGSATYVGPWGNSLRASLDTTMYFNKIPSRTYNLGVQTFTNGNSDSWTVNVACNYPNALLTDLSSTSLTQLMTSTFTSLNVNYRLGRAVSTSDIDFVHLVKSVETKYGDTSYAICAPFVSNSNSNSTNYGFAIFKIGNSYVSPMIIKSVNGVSIQYFSCVGQAEIVKIQNYNSGTPTVTSTSATYMNGGTLSPLRGCGQASNDCIIDLYTNRGWGSLCLFVVTTRVWYCGALAAIGCIARNCL
jgi:hypothetical protein